MNFSWRHRFSKKVIWGVSIFILMFATWLLYTKGPFGPARVVVVQVQKQPFQSSIFGIGTVDAKATYNIGPVQAGRLLRVFADQGQRVAAGSVLGEMDPVDLDQKTSAAAAASLKAQNSYAAIEAQVRDTLSRRNLSRTTAQRYQSLFSAHAVSQEALDQKNNEANATQAAYDAALANLRSAQDEISRTKAEYQALVKQRENLKLVSPVNGLVVARDAEPGTTVVAGQSVFRLVDPSTIWIRTRIDQARFQGITVGQKAQIILRSAPDKIFNGKVARLEVQADSVTEERFINVTFEELPGILPLGELAEVTVLGSPQEDLLVIPAAALKRHNSQTGVWRLTNNQLQFQPVEIAGYAVDGKIAVRKGLSDGETIVIYSAQAPKEGARVRGEKKP